VKKQKKKNTDICISTDLMSSQERLCITVHTCSHRIFNKHWNQWYSKKVEIVLALSKDGGQF